MEERRATELVEQNRSTQQDPILAYPNIDIYAKQEDYTVNAKDLNDTIEQPQFKANATVNAHQTLPVDQSGILGALYARTRENFIFKVYSIVGLQLLLTIGMSCASIYSSDFLYFQATNNWLLWTAFALMIISEITVFCSQMGRRHPVNLILLGIFTFCMSYFISFYCGLYAQQNQGSNLVLVATLMTLGIVAALTIYTFLFPVNFSILFGILIVIFSSMIMFGIFCWVAWTPFMVNLYCALGVILCGIYIVIDTTLIIGNSRRVQLSTDDYVAGALFLYIDIVQMFLYILMLLGKK